MLKVGDIVLVFQWPHEIEKGLAYRGTSVEGIGLSLYTCQNKFLVQAFEMTETDLEEMKSRLNVFCMLSSFGSMCRKSRESRVSIRACDWTILAKKTDESVHAREYTVERIFWTWQNHLKFASSALEIWRWCYPREISKRIHDGSINTAKFVRIWGRYRP